MMDKKRSRVVDRMVASVLYMSTGLRVCIQ